MRLTGLRSAIATCALAVFFAALLATPSAGADEREYLVRYRAYEKALEAGDFAAAGRHAQGAWEAAEKALGDHRLSAILAYNYGTLVAFSEPESAQAALQRARELQEAGIAELQEVGLRVYLAYTHYAVGGYKRRQADRLRKALAAVEADDAIPDRAAMWLSLASRDLTGQRYRKALETAAAAEAAILSEAPDDYRSLAHAILIGGAARLLPAPRNVRTVQAAHNEFVRARRLFPPQNNLDDFDPLLAQLLAWDGAADAALTTLGLDNYPDHEGSRQQESPPLPPYFAHERDPALDCQPVEWAERERPRFPSRALQRGNIGAVFVGYRLGEDLRVRDARVLAEIPAEAFGEAALTTMAGWRATALPAGGPECHGNLVTQFTFAIAY